MPQIIALVDDDRNIITSVSMALEAEGFEVRTYPDGDEALGTVVLRLHRDDQSVARGQGGPKIDGRCGLSHSAFLVCDRNDSGQGFI